MLGGNHHGVLSDLRNVCPAEQLGNAFELLLNLKDIIIFVLSCCIHNLEFHNSWVGLF